MTEKPLIYTSQGNVPEDSLIFETEWENQLSVKIIPYFEEGQIKFSAKLEGHMICKPCWYAKNTDGSKGELVKNSVLVYHTGIDMASEQGQIQ